METLPHEMVAMIALYLPVKDLASCCAVSPWWREMFGCDEVWRPRCDADTEDHLRTTPCRVEPKFISPEPENSTLSPIGRWRIAYMRENHLCKNWMHGNYVEDKISLEHFLDRQICFLNNNFVIAVSEDFIRLIDTTVEPHVCVAKCLSASGDNYCEVSVVQSDTFLIWDRKKTVQVIGVDWESYALSVKHTFCVSEGNDISKYEVVNTMFVGLDINFLHIWDLEKAIKLKTESCLDGFELIRVVGQYENRDGLRLERVYFDKKCENVCVLGWQELFPINKYLCMYNLKELRFWPFTKSDYSYISDVAIVEHYVALTFDIQFQVFNYETSQCLYTVEPSSTFVCTVGNSFMFIEENKDLVQLSPSTGVVTCVLSNISGFYSYNENRFIVYSHEEEPKLCKIMPKSTVKTVILNPSDTFEFGGCVTPNQTFSKVIIYTIIYNDWDEPQKIAELWTYW